MLRSTLAASAAVLALAISAAAPNTAFAQTGDYAIPTGAAVLIEYGADARVIPQGFNS